MWVQSTFFGSGGSVSLRSLAAYRQAHWLGHSNGAAGGVQSTRLLGGSTALTLVCRLPASSLAGTFKRCRRRGAKHPTLGRLNCASLVCRLPASSLAGTFKRCRRRISGTYRTYGTYRTKVDRMANFILNCLLWCGSRPPVQRKKTSDYASSASHPSLMSQMSHPSSPKIKRPSPRRARQDCGDSSDFCAEALREWTKGP